MSKVYLKVSRTSVKRVIVDVRTGVEKVSQTYFTKSDLERIIFALSNSDIMLTKKYDYIRHFLDGVVMVGVTHLSLKRILGLLYIICLRCSGEVTSCYYYIDCDNYQVYLRPVALHDIKWNAYDKPNNLFSSELPF